MRPPDRRDQVNAGQNRAINNFGAFFFNEMGTNQYFYALIWKQPLLNSLWQDICNVVKESCLKNRL